MMQRAKALSGELAGITLLLVVCLVVGLPRFSSNLDLSDEGFLAYGTVRVMQGQVPNLDFVSLQPPLSFYTTALVFKMLGTSLLSMRVLGLALHVVIVWLIYGIARCLTGRRLALAAALPATVLGLPFFTFIPYAVWQGIAASLGAALLFLRAASATGSRVWLAFPAGLLTAAAILFRHDQGCYLAVSLVAFLLLLKAVKAEPHLKPPLRHLTGFWLLGLGTLFVPFAVYWVAKGAWPDILKQLVIFPLTTYAKTSSVPYPSVLKEPALQGKAIAAFYFAPPVVEVAMAVWLGRKVIRRGLQLLDTAPFFILIWAGLYYLQVLARSDPHHLLTTLPPFFVLCATGWRAVLEAVGSRPQTQRTSAVTRAGIVASGLAGALVLAFLILTVPYFVPGALPRTETLQLERGGTRKLGANNLKKFIERVQSYAPPNRSILCLPYQPMFYFLCERRNPTRWNYLWPGDQTPEEHQALIRQAEADPPAVVVITEEEDMRRYAPEVLDYVHTAFRLAFSAGGTFTVYVRPTDKPGTVTGAN